jgi:hypothetical protein
MRKALVHFVFGMLAIVLSVDRASAQAPSFLPGEAEAICSGIVDRVMSAIVDNATYSCGFSNPDGRWTPNRQYQMNKCVAAINLPRIQDYWAYLVVANGLSDQVEVCKLTHVNKNCVSCHSSQAPSALQKNPSRSKSSNVPSSPSAETKIRATLPKGSSTSGKPFTDTGGGNAMDRLGGGPINQTINPRTGPGSGGSNRVAKPAGAGAVLQSPPSGAVQQSPPRSETLDYGGCAACGKRDTPKVR